MGEDAADAIRWIAETLPPAYARSLESLIAQAEVDPDVRTLILTGSLARRDGHPGTDIDLRTIVAGDESVSRFTRGPHRGIEVEHTILSLPTALADLEASPMHVYAYLDGVALVEHDDAFRILVSAAQERHDAYRTPDDVRAALRDSLGHPLDKMRVALAADDIAKAAFVSLTCAWQIVEGLWAANDRPLPPNSSVRPHLGDLDGPPDLATTFDRLVLGEALARADAALTLIEWIRERLARSR